MWARREGDSAKKQNNSITRTVKTEWSTYIASLLWSSGQMFWFESQQGGLSTIKSSIWNTIAEIDKTINNIHGGEEPNWEWKSWLKPLATSIIQIFFLLQKLNLEFPYFLLPVVLASPIQNSFRSHWSNTFFITFFCSMIFFRVVPRLLKNIFQKSLLQKYHFYKFSLQIY